MIEQNDIVYGYGHIFWGEAITAREDLETGYYRPARTAGWVLPGAERTTDHERALRAAIAIHEAFVNRNQRPERFLTPHNTLRAA